MGKDINKTVFDEATKLKLEIFGECFEEWLPVFNYDSVSGKYKCRFSVNKNASDSASLISDLQRNKILKNVIFEDCFSVFQSVRFTG